mmetsp:Transcript_4729/g.11812  ORF Transcript_4729/g.11812 Transcript_4729/m.11812 type:complete len:289 (+) Transcript_4729:156-1022(+)
MASAEELVERLRGLGLSFDEYQHDVLMTCDDFKKTDIPSSVSICKNMLLKDKKNRLILITALEETRVDLKVLSARLGLGKGGLRMAPDEMLGSVLQVPLGSVTPFALVAPAASNVVLLLDDKLRGCAQLALHPLVNTQTVAIPPTDLDKFLTSIGRQPAYVDLTAEPPINADNPPDLKPHLDSAAPYAEAKDAAAPDAAPAPSKKDKKAAKAAPKAAAPAQKDHANVNEVVQDCLGLMRGATPEAAALGEEQLRALERSLAERLTAMKNAAYATGFRAAKGALMEACK